jgi:hypothetical protein
MANRWVTIRWPMERPIRSRSEYPSDTESGKTPVIPRERPPWNCGVALGEQRDRRISSPSR